MNNPFAYVSLVAVILLAYVQVSGFDRIDDCIRGPLNPYAFFTDELRLKLEKASENALKDNLSVAEAMELLEKFDVRRCTVGRSNVVWTIAYFSSAKSVEYVYSPTEPYPSNDHACKDYEQLWNGWYWRRIR